MQLASKSQGGWFPFYHTFKPKLCSGSLSSLHALPIREYAAVTLLLFFGLKPIKEAWDLPSNAVKCNDNSNPELDELAEAEERVKEKEALTSFVENFESLERNQAIRIKENKCTCFSILGESEEELGFHT